MFVEAKNLNQALVLLSKKLVENGITVDRRGFKCLEYPGAVLLCIENPIDRYVTIKERKWNKTLGWIESLWIARGDNSLDMPASYVKNLINFSDDGLYMRAGYGPRIRRYGDNNDYIRVANDILSRQYKNGKTESGGILKKPIKCQNVTDQLRFVVEKFKEDINTREAVITIHDPVADDFNGVVLGEVAHLLKTKDTPCTRSIHFMIVDGKMNCYVDMRSNDCFTYDTKIPLLNGEVWEIGKLAEEKFDEEFWVYSRDENGKIVPGLAHHPRKVRRVKKIMKVTLDNGETIECTPDHRFMLFDGSYKEIKDIEIGESLSPLYRRCDKNGYEEIYYHDRWEKTHKVSYTSINGKKSKKMNVIHHKDFNKRNNFPDNLQEMSWEDHLKLHQEVVGILNSKLWNPDDPDFHKYENQRKSIIKALNKGNKNRWTIGDILLKKENQAKVMACVNKYLWNKRFGFREYMKAIQAENGRNNLKKLWEDEEFKKTISKASSKRLSDPNVKEFLAKLTSERNRENWKNPEYRNNMIKKLKESAAKNKEANSNRMKNISKKLWSNPDFVDFQRKFQKENTKKQWGNPEYRRNQIEKRRLIKIEQVSKILKKIEENHFVFNYENYEKVRLEFSAKYPSIDWVIEKFGSLEQAKIALLIGNHKIVSKEILNKECDVYDITVEKYHNFALESGVFVHNCIWGLSAVNVFNFTLMQEYVAAIVGVPVGKYYHKVDNLHVYEDFIPMVKEISKLNPDEYYKEFEFSGYTPTYKSLEEFDSLIDSLTSFEEGCRKSPYEITDKDVCEFIECKFKNDPLFSDWAKVIYRYWYKENVVFTNPYLNELFK